MGRKKLKFLMDVPGKWIDRAGQRRALDKLVLDLDSLVSETYGHRERQALRRRPSSVRRRHWSSYVFILDKGEVALADVAPLAERLQVLHLGWSPFAPRLDVIDLKDQSRGQGRAVPTQSTLEIIPPHDEESEPPGHVA